MLWYYDTTRRQFLQVLGLSAAGAALAAVPAPAAGNETKTASVKTLAGRAIRDARAGVVTCVPATGTAKIFDAFNLSASAAHPYSFNEEVAFTVAHCAGLTGVRAAAIIKVHGLAKAANSVVDALTAGTTAGFVAILTSDGAGRHSDNIFDYTAFVTGTGIPFKTATPETIYPDIQDCFRWSEELGLPVGLIVDANRLDQQVPDTPGRMVDYHVTWQRDPLRQVLCPPLTGYQYKVRQAKFNSRDWRSIAPPPAIRIPDFLPPRWQNLIKDYIPLFKGFATLRRKNDFVGGDTSVTTMFAFAPFDCIDVTTYYGGSLPLAIGAYLAGRAPAWAVTGDYAFVAAGHLGLIEALNRGIPLKVLIMHNGQALTTGGQPVPAAVFRRLLSGYAEFVSEIHDPTDPMAIRSVLQTAQQSDRPAIIVVEHV